MSATVDRDPEESPGLTSELQELRAQESALEQRTNRLEISNPLGILLAFAALAIAIGALVIALGARSDNTSMMNGTIGTGAPSGATSRGAGMMGATSGSGMMNGHGRFTASQIAAAASGTVYVNLGDYWAQPAVGSVRAGTITSSPRTSAGSRTS